MKTIPLKNSTLVAIIDAEDYDKIIQFTWYLAGSKGSVHRTNYARGTVPLAREVMNDFRHKFDHKDRNFLNNSKANLRVTTTSFNQMNRVKFIRNAFSKFKGVTKHKQQFKSRITKDGKSYYLGLFKTETEAAIAYDDKALELFGEHAVLNIS